MTSFQFLYLQKQIEIRQPILTGSIENAWYPNELPNWGTYLGTPKKPNLSGLLTMLLRSSIIKPINNQIYQKSHGFRANNIVENKEKT